jgi:hypothetical protein
MIDNTGNMGVKTPTYAVKIIRSMSFTDKEKCLRIFFADGTSGEVIEENPKREAETFGESALPVLCEFKEEGRIPVLKGCALLRFYKGSVAIKYNKIWGCFVHPADLQAFAEQLAKVSYEIICKDILPEVRKAVSPMLVTAAEERGIPAKFRKKLLPGYLNRVVING